MFHAESLKSQSRAEMKKERGREGKFHRCRRVLHCERGAAGMAPPDVAMYFYGRGELGGGGLRLFTIYNSRPTRKCGRRKSPGWARLVAPVLQRVLADRASSISPALARQLYLWITRARGALASPGTRRRYLEPGQRVRAARGRFPRATGMSNFSSSNT